MDNYIIRIYRRDPGDPGNMAGIIEVVETEEKKAFASISELEEILKTPDRTMATGEKNSRNRRKKGG